MKSINLLSLIDAKNDIQSPELLISYLEYHQIEMSNLELICIENLVSLFQEGYKNDKVELLEGFFVGYEIEQIGKEFDLLRFGKKTIVNIEIKSINTGEKIKNQLLRNKYYLSFLNKEQFHFTFVSSEKKLYFLEKSGEIQEVGLDFVISILIGDERVNVTNIHDLFDPTNYLVSPFNSTERFLENKFFLTSHQEEIKKQVLISNTNSQFISIQGSAGTGKTLLVYDIVKAFMDDGKKAIIIHCGILNRGQYKLISKGWKIISISELASVNLRSFDIIILDEVQRIRVSQLETIIDTIRQSNGICIFSYDQLQYLRSSETEASKVIEQVTVQAYKLTKKIRTNKEIAAFITALFDLESKKTGIKYINVEIKYYRSSKDARRYVNDVLQEDGWKIMDYTPSQYNNEPYDKLRMGGSSAHEVIGQEFDKVTAMIDEHFCYQDGKLEYRSRTYYHPTKMLFQMLTRTRKKLCLVIVNNEEILEQCLKILKA